MFLTYKGREVTPDLYCIEWTNLDGENIRFFTGVFAYQKAIIWANENYITGKVIYCLSNQYQNIVNGIPIKRGVKKQNKRSDFKNNSFTPQLIEEPANMKPV
jgi:hypothetical protein